MRQVLLRLAAALPTLCGVVVVSFLLTRVLPGDTANLGGGETMTVAEIVYSISPDSASMEVAE